MGSSHLPEDESPADLSPHAIKRFERTDLEEIGEVPRVDGRLYE
jgi:hypothetical protein